MIYKPKYCCHCGEKIERVKWTIFSSPRFCQLCEADYALQEWTPRVAVFLFLVLGVAGFSGYFQNSEKPMAKSAFRAAEQTPETKRNAGGSSLDNRSAAEKTTASVSETQPQNAANTDAAGRHQNTAPTRQEISPKPPKTQPDEGEPTYFCGAATKKGTPCSRRVKGGGRCWQHSGQPAVVSPAKLIANQ